MWGNGSLVPFIVNLGTVKEAIGQINDSAFF
jgi:hypothetical protein